MDAAAPTYVYILRGDSGRHYIGITNDLEARLYQHRNGHTHTTRRLGGNILLLASARFPNRAEATRIERRLKLWKHPEKAIAFLQSIPAEAHASTP